MKWDRPNGSCRYSRLGRVHRDDRTAAAARAEVDLLASKNRMSNWTTAPKARERDQSSARLILLWSIA